MHSRKYWGAWGDYKGAWRELSGNIGVHGRSTWVYGFSFKNLNPVYKYHISVTV